MERRCYFNITVSMETEQGTRIIRFSGEKSLPFIPSEGRRLHLGSSDIFFIVDNSAYDMERDIFLVDGKCPGSTKCSQELADGFRRLGWQEEVIQEGFSTYSSFNRG